uniref:Kinesin family member 15 n=1 Tax=Astyanax mexicanus TaxID=7994 RepID=A0A3B1JYZ8_ASTMX
MNPRGKGILPSLLLSDGDAIKVYVRVRPLTHGTGLTTDSDPSLCLTVTSPHTVRLHSKPEPRTFTYDHVADMNTTQESVFSSVAKNIVESCMNGYNGTIFAYGQTGSGKTFTMLGPNELNDFSDDLRGVIPRSFEYLFFLINREVEKSSGAKSFLCKCSFIEIYNEQIFDLLDSASASLFLREDIKKGVFVEGAVEKYAASAAEAYQVLSMGWRNRRVASTSMNRESSRSHAVFTMTLESKESGQGVVNIRTSQLNLVDLAGSERQRDTQAEGSRLKEASSINRSLMCLGQVIMALMDVSNGRSRHICYRDSKLTFLLRDSLGGNAKTYIIANVHPGSKCFGETLSTLQFAQRAKLIKNKVPPLTVVLMMQALQEKVSRMEEAWAQKEKFIQSNRMILKFRDDRIARLKQELEAGQQAGPQRQDQTLIEQLLQEIRLLRDQVEHHPRMMWYAAENCSLRDEVRTLRALESVKSAQQVVSQSAAELEQEFQELMKVEEPTEAAGASSTYSTPVTMETLSSVSVERLKAQLLQKQSELTSTAQAFEEYKQMSKKQLLELESEKRYLDKSNKHLENILEATKAHTKQEVCQLNKIHAETIKILTTPTKAYNLRSRLVPLSSPEHLNGHLEEGELEDIHSEQPPPEMSELACEALTEELKQMQDQINRLKGQLDEEGAKNIKLLQQISKLEEQVCTSTERSARREEDFSSERSSLMEEQQKLQEKISALEQQLTEERTAAEVLRSEVRDLRLVLKSSDKELEAVRKEQDERQMEQEKENTQLSSSLISTQLQLDKVRLEWEQLQEQQRMLQDSFDTLQAEYKFEADQYSQQLEEKIRQHREQQAQITELMNSLQAEREMSSSLRSQLKADRESTSKELLQSMEENAVLKKQILYLTTENHQQVCVSIGLEVNATVVLDLMKQTRDLRSELGEKEQSLSLLTADFSDITVKYAAVCSEREEMKTQISHMKIELQDLREASDRRIASERVELELMQEDLAYATEEVERLSKALEEQTASLQRAEVLSTERETTIHTFQMLSNISTLNMKQEKEYFTPCTPHSFNTQLSQVLESQERELESRRSSMMTMEVLLAELSAERTAKNEEIQRLKVQLNEKEDVRMEIQTLLEHFYSTQNQKTLKSTNEAIHQSVLRELREERSAKNTLMQQLVDAQNSLQNKEITLAQSQTCVQELTSELRNRCLELRELRLKDQEQEELLAEVEVLRKQVDHLAEENGKLLGHQNHKQKIEYMVRLKKEITKLQEENEKLRQKNVA